MIGINSDILQREAKNLGFLISCLSRLSDLEQIVKMQSRLTVLEALALTHGAVM